VRGPALPRQTGASAQGRRTPPHWPAGRIGQPTAPWMQGQCQAPEAGPEGTARQHQPRPCPQPGASHHQPCQ